nr:immunoglobulin heavy chain junction region [Mus musculus]
CTRSYYSKTWFAYW